MIVNPGIRRLLRSAVGRIFSKAGFFAPLQTSLVLERGTGSPTFTRATTAYVSDWESKLTSVLSGEARFTGGRRVANLVPTSSVDVSLWTLIGTATFTGTTVINTPAANDGAVKTFFTSAPLNRSFTGKVKLSGSGTITIRLRNVGGATGGIGSSADVTLSSTPTVFSVTGTSSDAAATGAQFEIRRLSGTTATSVTTAEMQFEEVTGQSNQNPSEYVSVGVLSAPYHGAGVDGVKYFKQQNGNTVSGNVVTEASGTSFTPSGYLAEGAGTQLVTPTASIRDMTQAQWVKTTMTTALTSTGADGGSNVATRCTASAGNALVLQTLVAAASSRTYSAYIRRVTGTGNIELTQDGVTWTNIATQLNSTTYTLVQLNASQLNASFGIRIVTNGDAIDVDFNQFEAGAFATSRMATAGATRNADVLSYTSAGNISDTSGAIYAEANIIGVGASNNRVVGDTVSAITPLEMSFVAQKAGTFDGTVEVLTANAFTIAITTKVSSSWSGATQRACMSGSTVASGAYDGAFGLSGIVIGNGNSGIYGGSKNVRNVYIWTTALIDAQLQSITS